MGSQIHPTEDQIQKLISLKTPAWNGTKLSRDTQLTQCNRILISLKKKLLVKIVFTTM
eukprot:Pgem_evm1s10559